MAPEPKVLQAIINELALGYILEDMPHFWDDATRATLLEKKAPRSAIILTHALPRPRWAEAAALLEAAAEAPAATPFIEDVQMRGRYAWFLNEDRVQLLSALLARVALGIREQIEAHPVEVD